ncbi:hypothetical protein K435DRAFT_801569 [Dendrothele bispora CBS 962.96]|uniref:Uncharacterized protein n=1 Tax=Dendrothele bispora (strain CBS 962.96) TaxID=1314807 RepID=A0A4S8LNR3_DENBC|nr:hypothetical protein K435DRAFT_801569 [Dendrothele bispora CBS 962.96]
MWFILLFFMAGHSVMYPGTISLPCLHLERIPVSDWLKERLTMLTSLLAVLLPISKLGQVFLRYCQLEGLMEEAQNVNQSVAERFTHHVLAGNFKDDEVFLGIVEAMILAKDRELNGKSMANFKYTPPFDDFMHIVPPLEQTYQNAHGTINQDYNWDISLPLVLVVDDSKLYSTLAPLF